MTIFWVSELMTHNAEVKPTAMAFLWRVGLNALLGITDLHSYFLALPTERCSSQESRATIR